MGPTAFQEINLLFGCHIHFPIAETPPHLPQGFYFPDDLYKTQVGRDVHTLRPACHPATRFGKTEPLQYQTNMEAVV